MLDDPTSDAAGLWGHQPEMEVGAAVHLRIGPCELWLERLASEWRVAIAQGADPLDRAARSIQLPEGMPALEGVALHRYAGSQPGGRWSVHPASPDRAIVVRPETPLHLPSNEEATLYVSLPLWLQLTLGAGERPQLDLPMFRPSDTWFGASPVAGELCYATRTLAKTELRLVGFAPSRAHASVRIVNRAAELLTVERIKLPATHMSIMQAPDGRLWTESVCVTHSDDAEPVAAEIQRGAPAVAPGCTLVREARDKSRVSLLGRALGSFLG
jgi:hypothetical protein